MSYKTDADDSRADKVNAVAGVSGERPSERATRVAGDVVPGPWTLKGQDANRMRGEFGPMGREPGDILPVPRFDPQGDMTGGGTTIPGPGEK